MQPATLYAGGGCGILHRLHAVLKVVVYILLLLLSADAVQADAHHCSDSHSNQGGAGRHYQHPGHNTHSQNTPGENGGGLRATATLCTCTVLVVGLVM